MNANEIIINLLEHYKIEYKHPYNIDYRVDSFDIDFFLPANKVFIILEHDKYNHEIYKDIKSLGLLEGYGTVIIPMHEINNQRDLEQYVYSAIHYVR